MTAAAELSACAAGPQSGGGEGGAVQMGSKDVGSPCHPPQVGPGPSCHGYCVPGASDSERATPHQLPEKGADGPAAGPAPGNPEAAETLLRGGVAGAGEQVPSTGVAAGGAGRGQRGAAAGGGAARGAGVCAALQPAHRGAPLPGRAASPQPPRHGAGHRAAEAHRSSRLPLLSAARGAPETAGPARRPGRRRRAPTPPALTASPPPARRGRGQGPGPGLGRLGPRGLRPGRRRPHARPRALPLRPEAPAAWQPQPAPAASPGPPRPSRPAARVLPESASSSRGLRIGGEAAGGREKKAVWGPARDALRPHRQVPGAGGSRPSSRKKAETAPAPPPAPADPRLLHFPAFPKLGALPSSEGAPLRG
ncbi:coiled-coil domain containing 92B isoform X1 [Nycticebus coucang]|uniref:coiled-coil domain containing 92B isoform X1 n=1 Tax=Nycticebus coucang TaxID=9470 RepID=UPI00234D68C2|nr:coiled-coil domain containing 92B isoform X1 [Nycticebus coucang]